MFDPNETWRKVEGNSLELPTEVVPSSEKLFKQQCCVGRGIKAAGRPTSGLFYVNLLYYGEDHEKTTHLLCNHYLDLV
jgi:hypothetical protein